MAVREIVGVLCLGSTIGLLLTLKKPKEAFDRRMTIISVVIQLATSIGALATGTSQGLETIIPEVKDLTIENEELKNENSKMKQNISDQSEKIIEQESKIKALNVSMKDKADFLDYKLFFNNHEILINSSDAIANINESVFLSEDAISSIMNLEVKKDDENKLVYIGKYPDATVSFLANCNIYDASDYFKLGKDKSYKIRGNTYTEGFVLKGCGNYNCSVSFNLGGKYDELFYNVGHVDESTKGDMVITTYLDNNPGENIVISPEVNPDEQKSILLNGAKELRIEWCGKEYGTEYGFINLQVK